MELMNCNQVLNNLYSELKNIGEIKAEIKEKRFPLAEDSDWHRTDTCWYSYNGVISKICDKHYVFTNGKTDYTWKHLAGVDEAVMYGKVDWNEMLCCKKRANEAKDPSMFPLHNIPDEENFEGLNDMDKLLIAEKSLDSRFLIKSWEEKLSIRNGINYGNFSYINKPIPAKYITAKMSKKTNCATLGGVPIVLEQEESLEKIKAKGLEPTGHQAVFYKDGVVQFLVNNVKEHLGI